MNKTFENSEPFIHNQRVLVVLFRWFKILLGFTDCFKLQLGSKVDCLLVADCNQIVLLGFTV